MYSRRIVGASSRILVYFLVIVFVLSGIHSIVLADSTPPIDRTVVAQGGEIASAEDINQLAREVHLQDLRTRTATLWIGGALGQSVDELATMPVGTQITDWQFREMYDETAYATLEDVEQPTLINIWASWCGPCRFEFPFLADIALNQDTFYDLWFLNSGDTNETAARRFLSGQPEDVTVFYDEEDQFNRTIHLRFFPTTVLMDTDGTIIAAHIGVVTPTVMRFFNAVASNPRAGSIDVDAIDPGDVLAANIQPVDPADATPLVYGQQASNEITDETWQVNYRFEGSEGDNVSIEMNSTEADFDAYLVLIGPDGERLHENDDGPSPPNAYIQQTLPANGTYVIVATRFLEEEGFSRGGFTLTLAEGEAATDPMAAANTLLPNVPVSGRLSRNRPQDSFIFDARAGQEVTFILEHDQPDEHLNFQVRIGATQRIVPFTATEEGEFTATVTMPEDNRYSIYVSRPSASRATPITYTLRAETAISLDQLGNGSGTSSSSAPPPDDTTEDAETPDQTDDTGDAAVAPDQADADGGQQPADNPPQGPQDGPTIGGTLAYGDVVQGDLTPTVDQVEYIFTGFEGDVVSIAMNAIDPGLDAMLLLYGPTGGIYAANDDNGNTTDSLIPTYILPVEGVYTIVATRFGGSHNVGGSGAFRLSLTLESDTATAPVEAASTDADTDTSVTVQAASIKIGETVEGRLNNDLYEVRYTFDGQAGDVVVIHMNGTNGDLDPYLSLETDAGKQLSYNDDNFREATNDALIDGVRLPQDGSYTIVATRYGGAYGTTNGAYSLTLDVAGQADTDNTTTQAIDGNPSRQFFDEVQAIGFGDEVVNFLDVDTTPDAYAFDGEAGTLITASLKRVDGDLDAGLVLIGPDGEALVFNQSYTGPADARLESVELTVDGEYILVVGLDDGETSGSYRLQLVQE